MSTKAIVEALRYYERHVGAGSYGEALVRAAREEVSAIRDAARVLDTSTPRVVFVSRSVELEGALAIIEELAKEET